MKLYRLSLLSSLLILISALSLSAQTTQEVTDKDSHYQYLITTSPSYCQNDGSIEIKIKQKVNGPELSQVTRVSYNLIDSNNKTYTNGYLDASPSNGYLHIPQLPGRSDYKLYIQIWANISEDPIETEIKTTITVEDNYVTEEWISEDIDKYRLKSKLDGTFHIIIRGSKHRPPILKFEETAPEYTGPNELQPTKSEEKDNVTIFHFEYFGQLPHGDYKYYVKTSCRRTESHEFTVYGPSTDLPTVPGYNYIISEIYTTLDNASGCDAKVSSIFQSQIRDKLFDLFESINMGFGENNNQQYPEFNERDFVSLIEKNYEFVIATDRELELIKEGTLDPHSLKWSNQIPYEYYPPEAKTPRELRDEKALPGAILIRVKRPNSGGNEYIQIPIYFSTSVQFKIRKNYIKTSDCSFDQYLNIIASNFCSVILKYYILQDGEIEPAATATPVHISELVGSFFHHYTSGNYTFEGYNPNNRYYVEYKFIDIFGDLNPNNDQGHIILEPEHLKPLYLFDYISGRIINPFRDDYRFESFNDTYLAIYRYGDLPIYDNLNITLIQAPEGYEEYRKVREFYLHTKPDPTNATNPFGSGMIPLGETISLSPEWNESIESRIFLFSFLYTIGAKGQRVVQPKSSPIYVDPNLPENPERDKLLKEHPFPRGIYRLKFEHPCQPGESYYIDLNMTEPNYEPFGTQVMDPVVDYSSCDEIRIYPFADGILDYAADEQWRPRNIAFEVSGLPSGNTRIFYFFPYDQQGNPIDHTKFYIPIKKFNLPCDIKLSYKYLQAMEQSIIWNKTTETSINPTGVDMYVLGELKRSDEPGVIKLPISKYNPLNDQIDWGEDGIGNSAFYLVSFPEELYTEVYLTEETPSPSYLRYSYVGYRCSDEVGYMEFKLINIPRNTGTVVLKDIDTEEIIASCDISTLIDRTVRWDLLGTPEKPLKDEYKLEITTNQCDYEEKLQEDYFHVNLQKLATSGGLVTIYPWGSLCPGETVTLTATNLGVPEENYKWEFDNGKKYTGRTLYYPVSAPHLSSGTIHYEHYKLTVTGTKCGTTTQEGTLSVSSDDLWWMPRRAAYNPTTKGLITPLPQTVEGVTVPTGTLSERETYDWNNPENWAILLDGKFYAAQSVPTRCSHVHIVKTVYNDGNKQLAPAPDLSREVTQPAYYGAAVCSDITFHSGGEVYNVPLLNYKRAMVRYNFGVDPTSPGYDSALHGTDGEKSQSALRLYTSEENFASDSRLYERDKLYLMATPLYDLYAGDYSFSASPYTYQLNFTAMPTGKGLLAGFDVNFSDPSPLQSVSLAQNYNSIGLIVARDEQGFNLRNSSVITQSHGILELPYFDRSIASRFYHHTYDASTGMSRFQYFDGKTQRFRKFYSNAQRSKNAYRFIFEDSETHNIPESATGDGVYTLDVDFGSPVQETMIGNPFMSTIDLEEFLKVNHDLEPYARIVEGVVATYEPKLKVDGQVHTFRKGTGGAYRFVSPLQAFVVKPKSSAGQTVKVLFPQTIMPLGKQATQTATLRSEGSNTLDEAPLRYMSLSMQSAMNCDRVVITFGQEAESIDKMLMSMDSRYPSISIIAPEDGRYKELYNDNSATGRYRLFTHVAEPLDVTMTLSGSLLANVVSAQLIDHKSGLQYELSAGKSVQLRLFPDDAEGRLELMVEGDFTAIVPMAEPANDLTAQYRAGSLTIRSSQLMESVRIVDGSGVTRYSHTIPSLPEYSERLTLSSGSYVIEVRCTNGSLRRVMLVVS